MRSRFFSIFTILLLLTAQASAQDCIDYSSFDHWIPTPWLSGNDIADSARWGASGVVYVGSSGIVHLDFVDPENPKLVAIVAGDIKTMDIDGDLLAVGSETDVKLFSLPDLIFLSSFPTATAASPAIRGNDLVVVTSNYLHHCNINHPEALSLIGSMAHNMNLTKCKPAIIDEHVAVPYISEYSLRDEGGMFVVGLNSEGNPVLTQESVPPPIPTESQVWYQEIVAFDDVLYLRGTVFDKHPSWYPRRGFLVEVNVNSEGQITWGAYGSILDEFLEDMTVSDDGLLIIGRDSNVPYSYRFNRSNYFAPLPPADGETITITQTQHTLHDPVVTVLEDKSLVLNSGTAIRIHDLTGAPISLNTPYINRSSILTKRGNMCAVLNPVTCDDPGGCGGWYLNTYNLNWNPPLLISGTSRYCYGAFDNLHWIGNRIFLSENDNSFYEMEVSSSGVLGELPVPSALERSTDIFEWDDYLVAFRDGSILVEALPPSDQETDTEVVTVSRIGHLARLGDLLYATTDSGTNLFDMKIPSQPVPLVGTRPIFGVIRDIEDGILFAIENQSVVAFDIVDPENPVALGTWSPGNKIFDLVCTGNRIYVAMQDLGLIILSFDHNAGWAVVGGTWRPFINRLLIHDDSLFTANQPPFVLPLDCSDSTPTLVAGFWASATKDGVTISWTCHEAIYGSNFVVNRRSTGEPNVTIAVVPAVVDAFEIIDINPPVGTETTYDLELHTGLTSTILATAYLGGGSTGETAQHSLAIAPNPANPITTISFILHQSDQVRLDIHSVDGRRVTTLVNGVLPAGTHSRTWNGRDETGRNLASGSYLIRLETETNIQTGRLSLIR